LEDDGFFVTWYFKVQHKYLDLRFAGTVAHQRGFMWLTRITTYKLSEHNFKNCCCRWILPNIYLPFPWVRKKFYCPTHERAAENYRSRAQRNGTRYRSRLNAKEQASMKRHRPEEIWAKLRQARDLEQQGQSQAQVCKTLGISVMTFHRWRKQFPQVASPSMKNNDDVEVRDASTGTSKQIEELRLENRRLRKIVTDLLLERLKLEEAAALPRVQKVSK
jgi:putative transposase